MKTSRQKKTSAGNMFPVMWGMDEIQRRMSSRQAKIRELKKRDSCGLAGDAESLRSDWLAVGNELRKSYMTVANEQ